MPDEIRIVDPGELDLDEYAALQRAAFDEVYGAAGVAADFLRPAHYAWKYACPTRAGRIAVVRDAGGLVASLGMMPLAFAPGDGSTTIAWQMSDGATLRRARGKGYFTQCLDLLARTLQPKELMFAFPSPASGRIFRRFGFPDIQTVPMYVRPLIALRRAKREAAPRPVETLAHPATGEAPSVVRDAAHIDWRYRRNPSADYAIFTERDGQQDAYTVLRHATVGGRRATLLMEFHAGNRDLERHLTRRAVQWGLEQRARLAVTVGNCFSYWTALRNGFVAVPQSVAPRHHVLVAWPQPALPQGDWRVQLGDWDAF